MFPIRRYPKYYRIWETYILSEPFRFRWIFAVLACGWETHICFPIDPYSQEFTTHTKCSAFLYGLDKLLFVQCSSKETGFEALQVLRWASPDIARLHEVCLAYPLPSQICNEDFYNRPNRSISSESCNNDRVIDHPLRPVGTHTTASSMIGDAGNPTALSLFVKQTFVGLNCPVFLLAHKIVGIAQVGAV